MKTETLFKAINLTIFLLLGGCEAVPAQVVTNVVATPAANYPLSMGVTTNDDLMAVHWTSPTTWNMKRVNLNGIVTTNGVGVTTNLTVDNNLLVRGVVSNTILVVSGQATFNTLTASNIAGNGASLTNLQFSNIIGSGDFSIVVIPDPQGYASTYPYIYTNMMQWIVNSKSNLNVQCVIGVGDVVDSYNIPAQWQVATQAWGLLQGAGIPFVCPPGNHDYTGGTTLVDFNTWFPLSMYSSLPWFGGAYSTGSENMYIKLDIGNRKFIVFGIEWGAANGVLD